MAVDLCPAVSGRLADLVVGETRNVQREDADLLRAELGDVLERLPDLHGELQVRAPAAGCGRGSGDVLIELGVARLAGDGAV